MRYKNSLALMAAFAALPLGRATAQVAESGYSLPLTLAIKAATKAIATCASNGYPVSAVVVDTPGVIKFEAKGDHSTIGTTTSAFRKAYTVVTFGPIFKSEASGAFAARSKESLLNTTENPMSLPAEITGREPLADDGSPLDALVGFYRAFNASDMNALAANWADGEAPSMDNPIGGTRRGWPAIRDGYAKLFSGPATVRVAFHDFSAQGNNDYHLFVGREKGSCETPSVRIGLRIRTSRWFVKMRGVWRRLHHHGSIDEPGMLADYQRVFLGAPLGATS